MIMFSSNKSYYHSMMLSLSGISSQFLSSAHLSFPVGEPKCDVKGQLTHVESFSGSIVCNPDVYDEVELDMEQGRDSHDSEDKYEFLHKVPTLENADRCVNTTTSVPKNIKRNHYEIIQLQKTPLSQEYS